MQTFNNLVQTDNEGNRLNPVKLEGINSNDPKVIGEKLNQLSNNARTNGEYFRIGELYGFKLLVKTEDSQKVDKLAVFKDNRFFVEGEGGIKYNYNNGHIALDPVLASKNFLNALDKIPALIEKYEKENERLSKDLPVLKEVMETTFRKEPELKELKSQLDSLSRQINLSLENKDLQQGTNQEEDSTNLKPNITVNSKAFEEEKNYPRVGGPISVGQIMEAMGDRLLLLSRIWV